MTSSPAPIAPSRDALRISDLCVDLVTSSGPIPIVRGVDLRIARGEVLGLVGESGSGKSMTALAALGLLPQSMARRGRIEVDGSDITGMRGAELETIRGARMGAIFQDPSTSLNPVMPVGRQISETVLAHEPVTRSTAERRALELLRLVGIPDAESRMGEIASRFSGGMRQRIMIAMAIACDPVLLIADEPTSALDLTIQSQIVDLLADLRARLGLALLLITHDLGVVAGIADQVAVMYAGRIVEHGSAWDVLERPRHPYTRALLDAIPRIDRPPSRRLASIEGLPPDPRHRPSGCPFSPRCGSAFAACEAEPPLLGVGKDQVSACWLVDGTEPA